MKQAKASPNSPPTCDRVLQDCNTLVKHQQALLDSFQEERAVRETIIQNQEAALDNEKAENKHLKQTTAISSTVAVLLILAKILPFL